MKLPSLKIGPLGTAHAVGALKFWKSVRSLSTSAIAEEAARPFALALVGGEDACRALSTRLSHENASGPDGPHSHADVGGFVRDCRAEAEVVPGSLVLHADTLAGDEPALASALAGLAVAHPDLRLALACHIPAFRPAVAAQLVGEASWENAKMAVVTALPGIIPFGDVLLPATALGDMIILTQNQAQLLLRIAAAYGLPPDIRERTRELLPVVGSAFGWRAVARELIGLVPGGIGVVVKGSVAYAGTYTVGKAAAIYYSTGQTLSGPRLQKLYKDALRDATTRVRGLVRRAPKEPKPTAPPRDVSRRGGNKWTAFLDKQRHPEV